MKKTLIALAVVGLAATSANATVIYQKDGTTIDVNGRVAVKVSKLEDKRVNPSDDGSRLRVDVAQELGNGLSAIGAAELRFGNGENFSDITLKRLYGGFKHDEIGTLTFGSQLTIGDDVTVADYSYNGPSANYVLSSGGTVRFQSPVFAGFSGEVDYVFGTDDKKNPRADGFVVGAKYENKFGDFGVKAIAAYSYMKDQVKKSPLLDFTTKDWEINFGTKVTHEKSVKSLGLGAEVSYDELLSVGVNWANKRSETHDNTNAYALGAKLQVTDTTGVYVQYVYEREKQSGEKTTNDTWYLGADHLLAKNVLVYLEGGQTDTSDDKKEETIHTGLRVLF